MKLKLKSHLGLLIFLYHHPNMKKVFMDGFNIECCDYNLLISMPSLRITLGGVFLRVCSETPCFSGLMWASLDSCFKYSTSSYATLQRMPLVQSLVDCYVHQNYQFYRLVSQLWNSSINYRIIHLNISIVEQDKQDSVIRLVL